MKIPRSDFIASSDLWRKGVTQGATRPARPHGYWQMALPERQEESHDDSYAAYYGP